MPPHAESIMEMEDSIPEAPRKNVTVAFNYQISLVDEFVPSSQKQRRSSVAGTAVESVPSSTLENTPTISLPTQLKRNNSNVENNLENANKNRLIMSPDSIRRSARDRQGKRDISYARTQVRYDMQMVPPVRKNKQFLQHFPRWWMTHTNNSNGRDPPAARRSSRLAVVPLEKQTAHKTRLEQVAPFEGDSSVIWIPHKRSQWEDSVSEMTAVCTSAGLHRYLAQPDPQKPFHPPLSRDYIRDRVDIDDPLRGYQVRHKDGGWLQGFLLWTNFTTWTHYFKWDSLHAKSGVQSLEASRPADRNGALAQELEACERTGDPLVGGVVFPEIAEIALVGGLGCGEYLLRMALDDIRASRKYKFVLLQATNESKGFYERFGFVRVGAICRYSSDLSNTEESLVGYRHWTHPNESDASLQLHGGPSYMMCLKLPDESDLYGSAEYEAMTENSFREHMERLVVTERKPTIGQLGGSTVPSFWKNSSAASVSSNSSQISATPKRKPGRRPSSKASPAQKKTVVQASATSLPLPMPPVSKRRFSNRPPNEPAAKRRRANSDGLSGEIVSIPVYPGTLAPVATPEQCKGASGDAETSSNSKASKKAAKGADGKDRLFHSIRGPDGRFVRVLVDNVPISPPQKLKPATAKPPRPPVPSKNRGIPPSGKQGGPKRVDPAELKKQKVKAYPRDRVHFYNRVVKAKTGRKEYFFVLNYDEGMGLITIVPMRVTGVCLGRHAGRPRYQCLIGETDENFRTESVSKFKVVPATMVMKTSVVAHEAWDVQDN